MSDISFTNQTASYLPSSATIASAGGHTRKAGDILSSQGRLDVVGASNVSPLVYSRVTHSQSYPSGVRVRFFAAAGLFLLGSALSVYALVKDHANIGILSAFIFFMAGLCAMSWLERASREQSNIG